MAFKISVTGKLHFFVWRSLLTTFTACVAAAQVPKLPLPYSLSAPSVAAGGVAQIRVTLAAPHQITSCDVPMELDPAVFGPATAVDAFSATGDQFGTTLIPDHRLRTTIGSDSGALDQLPGAPMLVINVPVLPNAVSGATTVISIPSTDFLGNPAGCTDVFGYQYTLTGMPAQFKVGGAFSIDSVTPGGGLLPAGTLVHVAGRGFTPNSAVEIEGVVLSSIAYLGPQAIDATIAAPADLTGRRVLVKNPDGALADFYPALFRKTETGVFSQAGLNSRSFPNKPISRPSLAPQRRRGMLSRILLWNKLTSSSTSVRAHTVEDLAAPSAWKLESPTSTQLLQLRIHSGWRRHRTRRYA